MSSRGRDGQHSDKRGDEIENKTPQKEEPPPPARKKPKVDDMLTTRTGGAYIPPAKLRMMQEQITDKSR